MIVGSLVQVDEYKQGSCGQPGSDWSYQYNPFTKRSECAPPNAVPKYNPMTESWEMVGVDWELKQDSLGRWQFSPRSSDIG